MGYFQLTLQICGLIQTASTTKNDIFQSKNAIISFSLIFKKRVKPHTITSLQNDISGF